MKQDIDKITSTLNKYWSNLEFKKAVTFVKDFDETNIELSNIKASIFIDAGAAIRDPVIVKKGISILQTLEKIEEINKQTVFYNLANGYDNLAGLEYSTVDQVYFNKDNYLLKAKHYFQKAISLTNNLESIPPELFINYGNCLNKLGRTLDALDCYENAIQIDPNHPMALGNKGIALISYAEILPDHYITHFKEAYFYLESALSHNPPPESIPYFKQHMEFLERTFPEVIRDNTGYPGYTLEAHSRLEKYLIDFCLEHKLYLNPCNYCKKCDVCLGDNALINRMLIDNRDNKYNVNTDPFLVLSSYLNQIKQDYISARFLLILSQYDNFDINFVDKNVRKIKTPDRSVNNVYTQLLKFAFKSFYDVLDKIACFIDYYLNLQIPQNRIYFSSLWYSNRNRTKIRSKIIKTNNPALNALFDIHSDLSDGIHNEYSQNRHKLTHRFLNISRYKGVSDSIDLGQFLSDTIDLAKITKRAILYTLSFIHIEERKKDPNNDDYLKVIPEEV